MRHLCSAHLGVEGPPFGVPRNISVDNSASSVLQTPRDNHTSQLSVVQLAYEGSDFGRLTFGQCQWQLYARLLVVGLMARDIIALHPGTDPGGVHDRSKPLTGIITPSSVI
jgi:hypothetical protein